LAYDHSLDHRREEIKTIKTELTHQTMVIHSAGHIPWFCVLSLVVTLGLTAMSSFVWTFGIPKGISRPSLKTSTSLHTSLWETDLIYNLEGDDDDDDKKVQHKEARQIEIIKYQNRASNPNSSWCPFYFFLHQQQRSIHDVSTKALHMDDELKRMESKLYQLGNEDLPHLHFPLGHFGLETYNGDIRRPTEKSYELVLRVLSKGNLGMDGVELAESVIERYEKFNPFTKATTKMMAFAMKACIAAGNLARTEHWLHQIEERYEITQKLSDFPGYYIYNPLVHGLKNMENLSEKRAAKLSMEILDKIDAPCEAAIAHELFPGRETYLDIMKSQANGYKGSAAFFRIEKVFRQLQKNYRSTGNHPRLKPSIAALTPVFVAASKCHFPHDDKVIRHVNALFDEYDQLYKETGDPDFCPNAKMCDSLNSIHALMNRHEMNLADFEERTMLLLRRMEDYNVQFKDPRDRTSALNRILHAAESQLPSNPMKDPLKTREIFVIELNTFKKFHDDDSEVTVAPNNATYQIFLRACAKLPPGEARSKLAQKAFQLCREKGFVTVNAIINLHKANPEHAIALLNSTNYLGFEKDVFPFEL
jgi:hypothetical protein